MKGGAAGIRWSPLQPQVTTCNLEAHVHCCDRNHAWPSNRVVPQTRIAWTEAALTRLKMTADGRATKCFRKRALPSKMIALELRGR